ncbi:hypothetical protein ACFLY6_03100 [Candidatus Dependentiae bacterium]
MKAFKTLALAFLASTALNAQIGEEKKTVEMEQPVKKNIILEFFKNRGKTLAEELSVHLLDILKSFPGLVNKENWNWDNILQIAQAETSVLVGTAAGTALATLLDRTLKSFFEKGITEKHPYKQIIKHALMSFYAARLPLRLNKSASKGKDIKTKRANYDKEWNRQFELISTIIAGDGALTFLGTSKDKEITETKGEEKKTAEELKKLRLKRTLRNVIVSSVAMIVANICSNYIRQKFLKRKFRAAVHAVGFLAKTEGSDKLHDQVWQS